MSTEICSRLAKVSSAQADQKHPQHIVWEDGLNLEAIKLKHVYVTHI